MGADAGALISGGADTAEAKLAVMEEVALLSPATRLKWRSCSRPCS